MDTESQDMEECRPLEPASDQVPPGTTDLRMPWKCHLKSEWSHEFEHRRKSPLCDTPIEWALSVTLPLSESSLWHSHWVSPLCDTPIEWALSVTLPLSELTINQT